MLDPGSNHCPALSVSQNACCKDAEFTQPLLANIELNCWICFCSHLKVLIESKYSMPWILCPFAHIYIYNALLTLLGLGGGTLRPPCHIFAYNRANTRMSVLTKHDFSQL